MTRLKQQIHAVLRREWDPVGVGNEEEAADEYDGYVASIAELLSSEEAETKIAAYLFRVQSEQMALGLDRQEGERLAKHAASKLAALTHPHDRPPD